MIREACPNDAEALVNLTKQVDNESSYMLYEAGERKIYAERQKKMIEAFAGESNSTILVAELDGRFIGYLFAIGGKVKRNEHSAYLVIGILSDYRGKGVGIALFAEVEKWAREQGLHRLELTVLVENEAGIALYKKAGFQVEGIKKDSLQLNGAFVDEYYMGKLLELN